MNIRETIQKAVAEALAIDGAEILIEPIDDLGHGDCTSNVAMKYAKHVGVNPRTLAESIVAKMGTIEGVSKIEIAGPGFINFTFSPETIASRLAHVDDTWGGNKVREGEHIMFEYTSPNLFKPLHIGNLVGNVVGESLIRLFEVSGAEVKRFNYPSDIGLTVAKGVWGLLHGEDQVLQDAGSITSLGKAYVKGNEAYENDPVAKAEIDVLNKRLYDYDARTKAGDTLTPEEQIEHEKRTTGLATSLHHLNQICAQLGTHFDKIIYEVMRLRRV